MVEIPSAQAARPICLLGFGLSLLAASPALADQVITDDLIVQGSTCTGFDCALNFVFGGDELALAENNTRVAFRGPGDDFSLVANSNANGGEQAFYIAAGNGIADPSGVTIVSFSADGSAVSLVNGAPLTSGTIAAGAVGAERQVKNVADAVSESDLINVGQLALLSATPAAITAGLEQLQGDLMNTTAEVIALSALISNPRRTGPIEVALGLGNYDGETALAFGALFSISDGAHMRLAASSSSASSSFTSSLSLSFAW